jgi:hypothetical protein
MYSLDRVTLFSRSFQKHFQNYFKKGKNMQIATASGLSIKIGLTAPVTRGLRETLNRLSGKDLYIMLPVETYWVETLSNPKKPNIWAGKGPSFDSDGDYWSTPKYFWRVLDNGYMTNYKNDNLRHTELFSNNNVDTQTFDGSREREPIRFDSFHDDENQDDNRSNGKRGRKSKKHIKFLRRAVM